MAENNNSTVFVESRIREVVKGRKNDFRMSEDFLKALDHQIRSMVKSAIDRADANGRKTLQPQDL